MHGSLEAIAYSRCLQCQISGWYNVIPGFYNALRGREESEPVDSEIHLRLLEAGQINQIFSPFHGKFPSAVCNPLPSASCVWFSVEQLHGVFREKDAVHHGPRRKIADEPRQFRLDEFVFCFYATERLASFISWTWSILQFSPTPQTNQKWRHGRHISSTETNKKRQLALVWFSLLHIENGSHRPQHHTGDKQMSAQVESTFAAKNFTH